MAIKFNALTASLDEYGPILTGTGTVSAAADGTAGAPGIAFASDLNTGIYSPGGDQLAISTGGAGRLFIDASGNIGIGTGSPVNSANYSSLTLQGATGGQIALRAGSTLKSYFFNDASKTTIGAVDDFVIATTGSITERLRITSAGLVGVGTSSPTNLIHGSLSSATTYDPANTNTLTHVIKLENTSTTASTASSIVLQSTGAGGAAVGAISLVNTGANQGALTFATRGGSSATPERMRIDSSGLVGVGTSTPDVRTHIVGTALTKSWSADSNDFLAVENSSTSAIDIRSGSAAGGNVFFSDGDARSRGRIEYSHVADELRFGTAGTNSRVVIDSSGRLLVGTSTSIGGATLQVAGTLGNAIEASRFQAGNAGPFINTYKSRGATVGTNTAVVADDLLGAVQFNGAEGSSYQAAANIRAFVDSGTISSTSMPGRLVFSTTADGAVSPTERLRITSAGLVGVGTSSPSSTLDVFGPSNSTQAEFNGSTDGRGLAISTAVINGVNNGLVNLNARGAGADGTLTFSTDGTERLRITSAGLVGIGTTSPSFDLTIDKDSNSLVTNYTRSFNTGSSAGGRVIAASAVGNLSLTAYSAAHSTWPNSTTLSSDSGFSGGLNILQAGANPIVLWTNSAERLRITSAGVLQIADAGNISVGTTTGTKIGTATTQKLGFYNKTPVVQPTAVADATDAASVITQLNALLSRMRDLGLIAT